MTEIEKKSQPESIVDTEAPAVAERRSPRRLPDTEARLTLSGWIGSEPIYREGRLGKSARFLMAIDLGPQTNEVKWYQVTVGYKIIAQLDGFHQGDLAQVDGYVGKKLLPQVLEKHLQEIEIVRAESIIRRENGS